MPDSTKRIGRPPIRGVSLANQRLVFKRARILRKEGKLQKESMLQAWDEYRSGKLKKGG